MKRVFVSILVILLLVIFGCSVQVESKYDDSLLNESTEEDNSTIDVYYVNHKSDDPTLKLLSNWNVSALREVWAEGNIAYLSGYGSDIIIVDFNDPIFPYELGRLDLGSYGDPIDIISSGNYAYVATRNGVCVVDISDKTNPLFVSYYATQGTARRMEIDGDNLFLADGGNGIIVFDVSDKSSITIIDSDSCPIEARKAFYYENYVYVADVQFGLRIYSFVNGNLEQVGTLATEGGPDDVYVFEDYVYLADRYNGVIMIDVSDKSNPVCKAHIITGGMTGRLMLYDNILFAVDRNGIFAINMYEKEELEIISSMETTDQSIGIHAKGDLILVAGDVDGLFIYKFDKWGDKFNHRPICNKEYR
ncbi:hypothetical protein KAU15_01015 [candidate division WOR-3 bacterium]|nr:hypothetical protein [candidate division WOR-3 bacterium]